MNKKQSLTNHYTPLVDVSPDGVRDNLERELGVRVLIVEQPEGKVDLIYEIPRNLPGPTESEWGAVFEACLPAYVVPTRISARQLLERASKLAKENRIMKAVLGGLTAIIIALILWILMMLNGEQSKAPEPEIVNADKVEEPAPPTPPEPAPEVPTKAEEPEPPKWSHVPSDEWPELLPGKWQGESDKHVSAVFSHKKEGSKTPWNVTLGEPHGSKIDWYGCGFYESGIAYCRRPTDEHSAQGLITVESKADTDAIRFVAFNGEFDYTLTKVAETDED